MPVKNTSYTVNEAFIQYCDVIVYADFLTSLFSELASEVSQVLILTEEVEVEEEEEDGRSKPLQYP